MPDKPNNYDEVSLRENSFIIIKSDPKSLLRETTSGILRCGHDLFNSPFKINSGAKLIYR
jgi:hypothetical protein